MKHGGKMLVCLAAALPFCAVANANTDDAPASGNPYQAIVERNVFGLKPPPPPPDPEANKPPLPKITLTGIVTLGGAKRALLKTPPTAGAPKPGEPPKTDQSFILCVGERQGELEVLEIDEKIGSVKVNYGGNVTDLNFEKDGVKAPPGPAPGTPGAPGTVPAPPKTAMPFPNPMGAPGATPPQFPSRLVRTPGAGGSAVTAQGGVAAPVPAFTGAGANVAGTQTATPSAKQPTSQLSVEEKLIMYEANRLRSDQAIQGGRRVPRLPRHPLAAGLDSEAGATAPAAPQ